MSRLTQILLSFCVVVGSPFVAEAAEPTLSLHGLFSDHMVLQRGKPIPVWGTSPPRAEIKLTINGEEIRTEADGRGQWRVTLPEMRAGGPHTLNAESAGTKIELQDVLVGDVWICSGQSNMEWPVRLSNNPQQEIEAAEHPQIRLFTVPKRISVTPQSDVDGEWTVCSPSSVPNFSAVGYYFGRHLRRELKVPIGLIHTSWGGTVAEAWTSGEALDKMPDFYQALRAFRETVSAQGADKPTWEDRVADWWKENDGGDPKWRTAKDGNSWKDMKLPVNWENANVGLDNFDGIVWFRREFTLPKDWKPRNGKLSLGPIDDADTTWVNGHKVGSTGIWNQPRVYAVPREALKPGRNVIAVRVFDGNGGGGIFGTVAQMRLTFDDSATAVKLDGDWKFRVRAALKDLSPLPQRLGNNPNVVTVLYNGMLAPLTRFGIKGAIWYQGESNANRPMQYRRLLPTMIADWRNRFEQGNFPFLVVQLANFMQRQQQPVQPGWAELREAQLLTARRDPQVGLAVTTDIGEANDIHPRNKQDVGKRLALSALKIAYGKQDVVDSGPTFKTFEIIGGELRLIFENVGSGLVASGDKVTGFAVARRGSDQFFWAEGRIEGKNTVVIWSDELDEPWLVRYNWANNPIGNLSNKEGLPAVPFRTDVPPTKEPK